jgi:hypothetical protein
MAEVALRHDLLEPLRQEAERQGISLGEFVNTLLSQHLAQTRREKLLVEFEMFKAKHAVLRARYSDEYVAMREGQVIYHDPDCRALHLRVRSRYGRAPVLIAQVTDKPVQQILIRSPRLEPVQ